MATIGRQQLLASFHYFDISMSSATYFFGKKTFFIVFRSISTFFTRIEA